MTDSPFHHHVLVCGQERPDRAPCCGANQGQALFDALTSEVRQAKLGAGVTVTRCGCLGLCGRGPNVVVYPEGRWYTGVRLEDVPLLVSEHLREGRELQGRGDPDAATIRSEASLQRARSRKLDAARLASGMLPEDFDAMLRSFQASRTVLTAVELDVFTAVGRGATAAEVADRTGTSLVGMSPLLHALVALGLLRKDAGRFHCGPLADSLLRADAAHDARAVLLHVEHTWHYWSTLTECVRRGTAVRDARIEERGPAWTRAFIAAMHHAASARTPVVLAALDLGGVRRILDLGGGSGAFSIAFARAVPDALVTLLDLVHGHASRPDVRRRQRGR